VVDEEKIRPGRPLVMVTALCSLQCFDTVGWVAGRTYSLLKNCSTNLRRFLSEQVEENPRGNWLTQLHLKKTAETETLLFLL